MLIFAATRTIKYLAVVTNLVAAYLVVAFASEVEPLQR